MSRAFLRHKFLTIFKGQDKMIYFQGPIKAELLLQGQVQGNMGVRPLFSASRALIFEHRLCNRV